MQKIFVGVLLLAATFTGAWLVRDRPFSNSTIPLSGKDATSVWVEIQPIQCLQNPWEIDWIATHPGVDYPRGEVNVIEPAEQEIITAYYTTQGIPIMDVTSVAPQNTFTCFACTCPQGYTLKLRVQEKDVEIMRARGYLLSPST